MESNPINKIKRSKYINVGLLAHVDAGKTTLSESILYAAGSIRSMGRVDKGNAFFDTDPLERKRGITIFSKQARIPLGNLEVTLLDTPGHVDFSAETEHVLAVLDYAILVISGADGVQGHTLTLWKLLETYKVPAFIFVNKMDQPGTDKDSLLADMGKQLSEGCVDFSALSDSPEFYESVAMCSEELMETFLKQESLTQKQIVSAIRQREVFPCFFGSALKMDGVTQLLQGMERYMQPKTYGEKFAARVFKIARDEQGNRLTFMKITGGSLTSKMVLKVPAPETEQGIVEEKADQLRLYQGAKFQPITQADAGMVCAVLGLSATCPGQGLGDEQSGHAPVMTPVLTYKMNLPEEVDAREFLPKMKQLQEEARFLVTWKETEAAAGKSGNDGAMGEIRIQVMGEMQLEIIRSLIWDRFHTDVTFDAGSILYKETIQNTVIGSGHYEPLRHYAEVHLMMEPGEPGSGLVFETACSEEKLAVNWQRLILTHLQERVHKGVLGGFPITDVKISIAAGRAHLKHTEGGDFRQATYRAVRQGLMEADSVLLEPWYRFSLQIPQENVGRAMTDLDQMDADFSMKQTDISGPRMENAYDENAWNENVIMTGKVPVSTIENYQQQVRAYTKGKGRLTCSFCGYFPCHNQEEVLAQSDYDPLEDADNPSGSVFCSHGAGYYVPWDEVKNKCHISVEEILKNLEWPDVLAELYGIRKGKTIENQAEKNAAREKDRMVWLSPDEIDRILDAAGGENRKSKIDTSKRWGQRYSGMADKPMRRAEKNTGDRQMQQQSHTKKPAALQTKEKYLLVDGYNIIYAWDDLRQLAEENIDGARGRLMDLMCNYQAFVQCRLLLVFDAYRIKGHQTESFPYHNITVIYTKEAETADQYIERFAFDNSRRYDVTVATSDGLEQIIIRSQGCVLLSARDFREELERVSEEIREFL